MKTRLTLFQAARVASYLSELKESLSDLSESELIAEIEQGTKISLTTANLRMILLEVGMKIDGSEKLGHYIAIAIANRMKWPIATLISEGKAHERDRIESIKKTSAESPPLKLPSNENVTRPVQSPDPKGGSADKATEAKDSDSETDFPE